MKELKFMIPIEPVSQQHGLRANFRFKRLYNDEKKTQYILQIIEESKHYAPVEPPSGALDVSYIFYLKDPGTGLAIEDSASDGDNLQKSFQDALSKAKFWKNDRNIVRWMGEKKWCEPDLFPRVEVTIKEYKP